MTNYWIINLGKDIWESYGKTNKYIKSEKKWNDYNSLPLYKNKKVIIAIE